MAKKSRAQRSVRPGAQHRPGAIVKKSPGSKQKTSNGKSSKATVQQKKPAKDDFADPHDTRANIPFSFSTDSILLVGEGDLSFARSLVTHHVALDVTATTFDSRDEVLAKYPQAADNISAMRAELGLSTISDDDPDDPGEESSGLRILHGVDATKLGSTKSLVRGGGARSYDRVVFNFPHVGGKSTDVNRQVRSNQELLVEFFGGARDLLRPGGEATVIVTLFEGEPYSLWNVRDLARHSGFEVLRSLRFEASRYPGYAHRRTLGNIDGGGGWKGEEREARTYIFRVKGDDGSGRGRQAQISGKRDRHDDVSSDGD